MRPRIAPSFAPNLKSITVSIEGRDKIHVKFVPKSFTVITSHGTVLSGAPRCA
jgi:hypothetical protein